MGEQRDPHILEERAQQKGGHCPLTKIRAFRKEDAE